MHNKPAALILAAGQGTRMKSALPKVLHPCVGLPIVCHVIRRALAVQCDPVVIVVSPATEAPVRQVVSQYFPDAPVRFAVQAVPQGTGDAARAGLTAIPDFTGPVFILSGDVPLIETATLDALKEAATRAPLAFLTAQLDNPFGYGRVVRDARGHAVGVVEQKDCTPEQAKIREINAGVYCVDAQLLAQTVASLTNANAQKEYYLTDIVSAAASRGGAMAHCLDNTDEALGVNNRIDLARVSAICQRQIIAAHQMNGVTFLDPAGTLVEPDVTIGRDVTVGMGVQLYGTTHIADNVRIEGPTVVINSTLGEGTVVRSFCHIEGARVAERVALGPYARLRPEAELCANSHVGNFVEIKKARVGDGAKVNHLTYVGDADIGAGSNIGAGTITCNYDGFAKHRTEIGANVFVGSNSTLVAPLKIGDGAFVAAGSTLTQEVPSGALAFGRAQQANREGYAERLRERLKAAKLKANTKKG